MKTCRLLPDIESAYNAGDISTCHMRVLGKVQSNPRIRHHMADCQNWFLDHSSKSFDDFDGLCRGWVARLDDDGPKPRAERDHEDRDVKLTQDFNGTWHLEGKFGSMQGAALDEILQCYIDAEWTTDWEKARAEHGDATSKRDMDRTDAQRRADALQQVFWDAASNPESAVPPGFVHNIHWDHATYKEMINRIDGQPSQPLDVDDFRCETGDGVPVDPCEAAGGQAFSCDSIAQTTKS